MIHKDECPPNPRKHLSNMSRLFTWEDGPIAGDVDWHKDSRSKLELMVFQCVPPLKILDDIKNNSFSHLKIREENGFNLLTLHPVSKEWHEELRENVDLIEQLYDSALNELKAEALLHYAMDFAVIQPLYLSNSSDSTLYTTPFMDNLDGTECGFAVIMHTQIENQFGEVTEKTIEKASAILEEEVDFYDKYLSCDSFEYTLYEDGSELSSNYYIYGDFEEVCEFISGEMGGSFGENIDDLLDHLMEVSDEEIINTLSILQEENEVER